MNLDHRPLQEADADTICTYPQSAEELFFMLPSAVYPLTPEQLLAAVQARPHRHPTVGLIDNRMAGFVSLTEVREKNFCGIGSLVVHPQFRRKGMATYLVDAMVQTAVEQYAVRFVRVSCFSHNKAAYSFCHKLGFRPADMGQSLAPDKEPVLLVHLHLSVRKWKGR
jgi:RimJ/RimL family protein N-acetyltransferase